MQTSLRGLVARPVALDEELHLQPAASEIVPGWQLTLNKTENGYWFMIKDKTDPCGFTLISNQAGLIYNAEPMR